ncbi:hypothetical protein RHGRI_034447 [Rhododendron griersonianum]|uniref:Uncharacterized protein n=1 Tax=Rhododendron griersonianum TaxID=479676 RepID=A0AAV6I4I3_9ERIC|nr:hypothetical protein RHGRI_034447 [Rhododendron griersonianum]
MCRISNREEMVSSISVPRRGFCEFDFNPIQLEGTHVGLLPHATEFPPCEVKVYLFFLSLIGLLGIVLYFVGLVMRLVEIDQDILLTQSCEDSEKYRFEFSANYIPSKELIHLHEDLETLRAASGLSERQLHKVIQEQGALQNENETLRCTKEAYESHIHHMEPLLVRERQQASDRDRAYLIGSNDRPLFLLDDVTQPSTTSNRHSPVADEVNPINICSHHLFYALASHHRSTSDLRQSLFVLDLTGKWGASAVGSQGGSGGDENTRSEVIRSERGGNEPITPRRHRTWARGIRRGKSLGFVAILHNVSL